MYSVLILKIMSRTIEEQLQLVDTVVSKIIEQGGRSLSVGSCAYRGNLNRRCGVGLFIDDNKYCRGIEGKNVHQWSNDTIDDVLIPEARGYSISLWAAIQRFHDNTNNWLRKVDGSEFGLSEIGKHDISILKSKIEEGYHTKK